MLQVLTELKPFVALSEKLGRLAVQLVSGGSGIKNVKVTYASARAPDDLDTRLLRAMIAKGLIEPISDVFVNLVNADFTAKQRGLRITEERINLDGSPESPLELIQVQIANVESKFGSATADSGEIKVEGRVKDGIPHLTKVVFDFTFHSSTLSHLWAGLILTVNIYLIHGVWHFNSLFGISTGWVF